MQISLVPSMAIIIKSIVSQAIFSLPKPCTCQLFLSVGELCSKRAASALLMLTNCWLSFTSQTLSLPRQCVYTSIMHATVFSFSFTAVNQQ